MQRRKYLAVLGMGSAGFFAGCAEDTDGDGTTTEPVTTTESGATDTPTDPGTETQMETSATNGTETNTETQAETTQTTTQTSGEADVSIANDELVERQTDFGTEIAATGSVRNDGDGWAHMTTFSARVYNADDNLLDTLEAILLWFPPGQTWAPYVEYLGDGEPDRIETELEVDPPSMTTRAPEDIALDDSSLNVGEDEATITGTATNNRDETMDYLEATGHFLDGDGVILSSNYTNVTDLPAGETWQFSTSALLYGDRLDNIADHQVVLST